MARATCGFIILILAHYWATPALADSAHAPECVFSQTCRAFAPDGQSIAPTIIDPEGMRDLSEHRFELGDERTLVVRTNLAAADRTDLPAVADIVRRCYAFLEEETGREIEGGVLLYLLRFAELPLAYEFRVELADRGSWNQVRLSLLREGETLTGPRASRRLNEMLYGTLPHELTHGLIAAAPTVRHDVLGKPSAHSRWFVDGICEALALRFAYSEDPVLGRRMLADRGIDRVLKLEVVRSSVFRWGSRDGWSHDVESDFYGAAMLLVSVWLESESLADLLAELSAAGGDHDGSELKRRFARATGLTSDEALARAALLGRRLRLMPELYGARDAAATPSPNRVARRATLFPLDASGRLR